MTRRWMRACSSAVLAGALAMGALSCTQSQQAAAEAAVANPEVQELLRHVPADTPYAWVGLEGSSRVFAEKIMKRAEPLVKQGEAGLASLLSEPSSSDHPSGKVLRAVLMELQGKLSIDGLEQLGFDLDARSVVYGLGLLPAMRVHMKDTSRLRATLGRVQTSSGVTFPVANHNGQDYWHTVDGKIELVVAFVGDDFVAGVILAAAGPVHDKSLAVLLGQEKPEQSLAEVAVLKDVITTHGLGQYSAGFVDVRGVTDALVGVSSGYFNKETAAALMGGAVHTPECVAEYQGLAGLMPRVAFGTTRLDEAGVETRMIAELRADLTAGLSAIRTRVPGLDAATSKDVLFGMGSGADVGQALELARAQAAIVQASPFKCAKLGWLNEAAGSVVRGVPDAPLPVRQLRGFALALEEVAFISIMPTNIRGYMSVGTADPQALIKTLKALSPGESSFLPDLAQEGVPERINVSGMPIPLPIEPYMAGRRDVGLAITVGADAEKRAGALLSESGEAKPLLVFHVNMSRIMKMLPKDLTGVESTAMLDILGSQGYIVDTSDRGLVMRTWVNFAE